MTSRRALLKAGTGFAAGAAVAPLPPNAAVTQSQDSDAAMLEHLLRADPNTRRILLKGGTIISMDPTVGDFAQGDVLIDLQTQRASQEREKLFLGKAFLAGLIEGG